MPWHATLFFEPIIEPKSVITRESHPKLVSRSSFISPPFFLPCIFLAQRNGRCSSCFHRFLENPFPRLSLDWKRRSPSGISHCIGLVFILEGKKKVATWPLEGVDAWKVKKAIDLFLETFKF